jgi:hypothetical protein
VLGVDAHERFERELLGRCGDLQRFVVDRKLALGEGPPIDCQRERLELLTREHERRDVAECNRIAAHGEPRAHERLVLAQVEVQIDAVDPVVGGPIVAAVDDLRLLGAHRVPPDVRW